MGEDAGFATGRVNRVWLRASGGGLPPVGRKLFRFPPEPGGEMDALGRCSRRDGVGPLEHLCAAAAILGRRGGWELWGDHPDLPLFDGSALRWAEALSPLPTESFPMRDWPAGRWDFADGRGRVSAQRHERFELAVTFGRGLEQEERWEGDEDRLAALLPARTFATARDFACARAALPGVTVGAGRLLRGAGELGAAERALARELGVDPAEPVWSGGAERVSAECAAHKALDLVGDIALFLGYLPPLRIVARDAGHALHHALARALREAAFP